MSSEPAIRARELGKVYHVYARPEDRLKQMLWRGRRRFYREFAAVRDVDLDVWRGETVGVVGRNGSGKSTLLKMICGILEPTTGSVEVRGHIAPLLAIGTGFNSEFSGRENVLLNAALLGLSDEEIRQRFDSIVEFSEIGQFLDQPVRSYSSGMYARLAFATAIHCEPDVLVVDEILAVGDEAFTRKCFARIEQIKAAGSTILFVSHALNRVVELCDRAVLIEGGERLLTSDAKTVVEHYRRLVGTRGSNALRIRAEIRALDGGSQPSPAVRPGIGEKPMPTQPPVDLHGSEPSVGRFESGLRPSSTLAYECHGARIENVRILDASGRRMNVLKAGTWYQYCFDVRFFEDARRVRFGLMLKLPTGFELAGQTSHSPGSGLEFVAGGTIARVRFPFVALLVAGVYFGNAGVVAMIDGRESYLHRVLDAVAFRVDGDSRGHVTGRVDLAATRSAEIDLEPPEHS